MIKKELLVPFSGLIYIHWLKVE